MSQAASITVPEAGPKTPQAMAQAINDSVRALLSQHSGSARPDYAVGGMPWIDSSGTPWKVYTYDGANDVLLGTIDPTGHSFQAALRGLEAEIDIASAATTDLGSKASAVVRITGTTQINSFGTGKNLLRFVRFAGDLTLKNGAALALPGTDDIAVKAGDCAAVLSDAAGNWRVVGYQRADGSILSSKALTASFDRLSNARGTIYFRGAAGLQALAPDIAGKVLTTMGAGADPVFADAAGIWAPGTIQGLTLSRAGASLLGIATGSCRNDDGGAAANMTLAAAITKSLSAWAAGTGNGGLDTGAIAANTWYHAHLIQKDSDGSKDAIISLSLSAPTTPAGYTARRYLGSILTDGSSQIVDFVQVGDTFLWKTSITDASAAVAATTDQLVTLSVPPGISVEVDMMFKTQNASVFVQTYGHSALVNGETPSGTGNPLYTAIAASSVQSSVPQRLKLLTNTSRQIGFVNNNVSSTTVYIVTYGYINRRGKL